MYNSLKELKDAIAAIPGFAKIVEEKQLKNLGTIERHQIIVAYIPETGRFDYATITYSVDNGQYKPLNKLPSTFLTTESLYETVTNLLEAYLKANFDGFFIDREKINPTEKFATATVYTTGQSGNTTEERVFVWHDGSKIVHEVIT